MALTLYLVLGFVFAALCRAITPERQTIDILSLVLMGIGGAYFGGFIATAMTGQDPTSLHTAGVIGALLGAVLLLSFARLVTDHRHPLSY